MTPDQSAIAALGLYAAVAVGAVAWQTVRSPSGPMIHWLYVGERLACGLLWRVRGVGPDGRLRRCPFPQDSAALVVANHRSPADPVALWQNHHLSTNRGPDAPRGARPVVRPISYLMAREFYDDRRLTWFYKAMRAIPVGRDGRDMAPVRQAIGVLKAGGLVGIFPEGGINHGPPGLKAANPGVAFLALATDAPVYPVYIDGAPVGATMLSSVLRTARTRLIYGDPVDLSAYRGRKKTHDLLCEVTDVIMCAVAALGGVTYAGTPRAEAEKPPHRDPKREDGTAAPPEPAAAGSGPRRPEAVAARRDVEA